MRSGLPIETDVSYWTKRGSWIDDPRGVNAVIGYRRQCDTCHAYQQPLTTEADATAVTRFGEHEPVRVIPPTYRQACTHCGVRWPLPRVPHIEIRLRDFFFTLSDAQGHVSFHGETASLLGGPAAEIRAYADHLWRTLDTRIGQQQETGWGG